MFTKYAEVEVVNTTGADEVVAFLKKLFLRHGCPTTVLSDNGKAFISASVTKLYEEFGIQGKKTTPYNPQGNGVVERLNKTLKEALRRSLANEFEVAKKVQEADRKSVVWGKRVSVRLKLGGRR